MTSVERRMRTLFLLAWTARMTLALMAFHWGVIGGMVLIKAPIDWAADFTRIFTLLVGIGCASVLTVVSREPKVVARMRSGPGSLLRFSYWVLASALVSNVAGTVLLIHDQTAVAMWAIGLSTIVLMCEASALVGSMFLPERDNEGDRVSRDSLS